MEGLIGRISATFVPTRTEQSRWKIFLAIITTLEILKEGKTGRKVTEDFAVVS